MFLRWAMAQRAKPKHPECNRSAFHAERGQPEKGVVRQYYRKDLYVVREKEGVPIVNPKYEKTSHPLQQCPSHGLVKHQNSWYRSWRILQLQFQPFHNHAGSLMGW